MQRLLIFVCCFCFFSARAQRTDSLIIKGTPAVETSDSTDMLVSKKKNGLVRRFFNKDYPSPKKALLLSAVLPGSGQMYNKKWWKVPIVYTAIGAVVYFEVDNIREYRRLRDNYLWVVDDDPNTNPFEEPYTRLDATRLKYYRDVWRRYVEQTSLALGFVYLLTATDAFVDAHLSRFDVSDDLSLRISPKAQAAPGFGFAYGLGVNLQFGHSRKTNLLSARQHIVQP